LKDLVEQSNTRWRLFDAKKNVMIPPRQYSSKSQIELVEEVLDSLKKHDIVFIQGAVGTGKSVVALHLIAEYGRGIIQTPTKSLEMQYQKDYHDGDIRIVGKNKFLDIKQIKGRDNFPCPYYNAQVKCSHKNLPCKRPLRYEYDETRLDVARECPFWTPVVRLEIGKYYAEKLKTDFVPYTAVGGRFCFVFNEKTCPYFSQYLAYTRDNTAIIMNSAIWEIETFSGRKASVPIEIIDEGDAYLDSLCFRVTVSKRRLENILRKHREHLPSLLIKRIVNEFSNALETAKKIKPAEELPELLSSLAELSYRTGELHKITVIAKYMDRAFVFSKDDRLTFYFPEPSFILEKLKSKSGKLVFMSATFQKSEILEEVFGIKNYKFCFGETKFLGTVFLRRSGKEVNVNYKNWKKGRFRRRYFELRDKVILQAKQPKLVLVWGKKYAEGYDFDLNDLKSIHILEDGDEDWSTVANRGIDLPDDKCRALILLKCPYPDLNDPILKTMRMKIGESAFWKYYRDMMERNLIQQVGRGVRHKEDWVEVWSPDNNVHRVLPKIWNGKLVIEVV